MPLTDKQTQTDIAVKLTTPGFNNGGFKNSLIIELAIKAYALEEGLRMQVNFPDVKITLKAQAQVDLLLHFGNSPTQYNKA